MSDRRQSSGLSAAADPQAVEPSSASPGAAGEPHTAPTSLQAGAHCTAPASPSAPSSTGGGGSQWAAPHRAASDAGSVDSHVDSHHSWGTHVSHHSHRSRWSVAATCATTVAPRPAEPRLLDLEEGGSSDEGSRAASPTAARWRGGDAGGSGGTAAMAASPRSSRHSMRSRSGGRTSVDAGAATGSSSRRLSVMDHPLEPAGSGGSMPGAVLGGLQTAESAAAAGKLPPRLIVFNPDGQTFDIAVDKLREDQLAAAAEAAAAERRREQQRAAAAALGPGGTRPAGGSRAEQLDQDVVAWRAAYARQKLLVLLSLAADVLCLAVFLSLLNSPLPLPRLRTLPQLLVLLSLAADVVYLIVLLVLRLAWGGSDGQGSAPDLNTAAKFFVGSHPDTTSISFIAGTLFTDLIALYGVIQDYPSVVTLFIVWSVVLGAFAILEMPLLFMLLRLLLLVLAFQLRFSMARLHSMLPPASLAHLVSSIGQRTASAGRAVWGATTRPFRGSTQRSPPAPAAAEGDLPPPVLPLPQRHSGGGLARSSPTVAAARSSALFRAAVMRMMSEQQREQQQQQDAQQGQQAAWDVEQGGGAGGSTRAQASSQQAGPSDSGSGAGSSRRQRSVARSSPAPGSSTDALYARILEDIAAVAAAPSSSSGRRRQRRRERDSRRRQAAGSASGSGPAERPSSSSRADHSEGSGEEDAAVRAALGRRPSTPAAGSSGGSQARPQEAVDRAAAVVQRSAGANGSGGAPTWDDLMALLAVHSLEQAARRHQARTQVVVPLVSLEAPPPMASVAPAAAAAAAAAAASPPTPAQAAAAAPVAAASLASEEPGWQQIA